MDSLNRLNFIIKEKFLFKLNVFNHTFNKSKVIFLKVLFSTVSLINKSSTNFYNKTRLLLIIFMALFREILEILIISLSILE